MANDIDISDSKELGKDNIGDESDYDLLNETPPEEKDDKEVDKNKALEDDEPDPEDLEELEVEEKEEVEEEPEVKDDDEVEETRARPSIKSMIKKIPELEKVLKAFPQLRDSYYREGKLTQYFPTVEDAKEAYDKAEALDAFDTAIRKGSSKELLESLHGENPKTLKKFIDNFLPTLQEVSDDLFYEATIPVVNIVIRNLFKTGEKAGGKEGQNMMAAARILSHHLHGEYDIPENEKKVDPEIEAERKKLDEDKKKDAQERYEVFETSVNERGEKFITKHIENGLDPDNSLSDFTKSKIIDEVIKRIGAELEKDKSHINSINRLWKAAQSERFSNKSADRILSAYLSRAKQLIPEIRSKVKQEALGIRKKSNNGIPKTTRRESSSGGRSSERRGTLPTDPKKVDWRKMSDKDILNS